MLTSEIAKFDKKIEVDQALEMDLWKWGNAEARILALQVADPKKLTRSDADALLKDGPVRFIGCYLSDLVARSPVAEKTMRDWMKSADEFTCEMGYGILAARLKEDPDSVSDADAGKVLATIEKEIHRSPNWARRAMNAALMRRSTSSDSFWNESARWHEIGATIRTMLLILEADAVLRAYDNADAATRHVEALDAEEVFREVFDGPDRSMRLTGPGPIPRVGSA